MNQHNFNHRSHAGGSVGQFMARLAAICLIVIAMFGASYLLTPNESRGAENPSFASGSAWQKSYFRSGRWLADMRTMAAMIHYVLEPEPAEELPVPQEAT
jgi:hypothetical protein